MSRLRSTLPLLLALLALGALVGAGCGGGDDGAKVASLMSDTFSEGERVKSGKLDLTVDVDAAGLSGLPSPLRIDVNGPFQGMGGSKPPKFDFDLALKTRDGRVQIGAISTGADSWMKLGTRAYTLRKGAFDGLVESSGGGDASAGLSTFGVDPRPWMNDTKIVGTEDLDGERVVHLRAGVDVPALIEDLGGLFGRAGGAAGGAGTGTGNVTEEQRQQIAEAVEDATVDIWTGEKDRKLRRISVDVDVATEAQQDGRIRLDLAVTQLNREQPIGPPANPRPLSELTAALAELGARTARGEDSGDPSGTTGAQGATPLPENASAYDRCIAGAGEDIEAAQRCAELVGK
jgi:hypothetical protein